MSAIHCLAIPTPFAVGRVNCYLIEDDPLTLVDCGPNSGKALDELEQGLAALGYRIEDLGLLVLTHQHLDHIGLAEILVRRSGAEVAGIELLEAYMARFAEASEADDAFAQELMVRNGVPAEVAMALRSMARAFRAWGCSVQVTRSLSDGDVLALGSRSFEVFHRPGHSPTDTIFWDAESGDLLGGDHLLKNVSSNPLVARPLAGGERVQSLVTYLDSMRRTRELPAERVLPGHGPAIEGHAALIDDRFRMHERRAEKIFGRIAAGAVTAHEIATGMWGDAAVSQAYLTLSEVLGHVDLLINDGRVRVATTDGIDRFVAVS